ncbi:neprilysin-21-like [Ornithodoros turicata]|uniref:neprilysin-21-like n=1 Tax=Ornithodoros turicata TaxID=34597 RepID=UPI00313908E4
MTQLPKFSVRAFEDRRDVPNDGTPAVVNVVINPFSGKPGLRSMSDSRQPTTPSLSNVSRRRRHRHRDYLATVSKAKSSFDTPFHISERPPRKRRRSSNSIDSVCIPAVETRPVAERNTESSTQTRNAVVKTPNPISPLAYFRPPANANATSRTTEPDSPKAESTAPRDTDQSPVNVVRRDPMNHLWNATCFSYGCCIASVICMVLLCFCALAVTSSGESLIKAAGLYMGRASTTPLPLREAHVPLIVEVMPNATEPTIHSVAVEDPAMVTREIQTTSEGDVAPWCTGALCEYDVLNFKGSSFNPCENFHKFACYRWSSDSSNQSRSFDTDQNQETENILQTLLTGNKSGTLVGAVYDLCKDEISLADSKVYLASLLQRTGLAKWPHKHTVLSKTELWRIHARIFRLLGISLLVSISIVPDLANISRFLISLDAPESLLHASVRLPGWYLSALYRATSYFEPNFFEDISQRVLKFVSKLAQLRTRYKERPQVTTLDNLPSYVHLIKYTVGDLHKLTPSSRVVLQCQAYFKALEGLATHTKSADIYNFFGFRVVLHMSPVLSNEFEAMSVAQMARMTGRWQTMWPRWQRCLWYVDDMDPALLLNSFGNYVQHQPLDVSSKIHEISTTLFSYVGDLEWCLQEKGRECLRFLNSTNIKVINTTDMDIPPVFTNITAGYFVEDYLLFKQKSIQLRLASTKQLRCRLAATLSVFSRNPSYDPYSQSLYLPTASTYATFHERGLHLRYPYMLHKVFTALLRNLRLHVLQGYVAQSRNVIGSTKCVRYQKRSLGLDGQWSLKRLKIDTTSWDLTFRHCFRDTSSKDNTLITGMSAERAFFILAAIGRCRNNASETVRSQMASRSYVAGEDYVNEPFLNLRCFGRVWSCPDNSSMNPVKKCSLSRS